MVMCRWILVQFWWFSPSVPTFESATGVLNVLEIIRNERIGLSTLVCGAVHCQRTTSDKLTTAQSSSMRRQIWTLVYEIQGRAGFGFMKHFSRCDKSVYHYSPSSDTFRTCCLALVAFNTFPMTQNQEFWKFWFFPTFFVDFGPGAMFAEGA